MQVYRTTHLLHWISAAVCFTALALFTITGITLNHAGAIGGEPVVTTRAARVPEALRGALEPRAGESLAPALREWIETELGVAAADAALEWSDEELYLSAPAPGRDAWVSIDRATGAARSESTDRGWIAYLNDLHKGRNTGPVWSWFIDVFALACLVFAITGLLLLKMHAGQRGMTWPMVALGFVLPAVIALIFIH